MGLNGAMVVKIESSSLVENSDNEKQYPGPEHVQYNPNFRIHNLRFS